MQAEAREQGVAGRVEDTDTAVGHCRSIEWRSLAIARFRSCEAAGKVSIPISAIGAGGGPAAVRRRFGAAVWSVERRDRDSGGHGVWPSLRKLNL